MSWPASFAAASVRPTEATCGWQNVAPGIRSTSTAWVGAPAIVSTATTPSSEALWASAGPRTRSPIAKTFLLVVRWSSSILSLPSSSVSTPAPERFSGSVSGRAAAGDHEVVRLALVLAVGELDRLRGLLDVLDRRAGRDRDALLLEGSLDDAGAVLVLEGEDLAEHLDQGHLGAVAHVGRGDLGARGAGADDRELLRLRRQRPCAPGVDDPLGELDSRDRHRDGAGREHDVLGLVRLTADGDVPIVGQRALALDLRDLVLVPEHLHAARKRLRDARAALAERLPVDRRLRDLHAQVRRVLRVVEDLGRVEHRLRRDAGVVEAAPARLVLLDDGRLQAELGGADRRDVPAGTTADHDYVEGFGHAFDSIETPPGRCSTGALRSARSTSSFGRQILGESKSFDLSASQLPFGLTFA